MNNNAQNHADNRPEEIAAGEQNVPAAEQPAMEQPAMEQPAMEQPATEPPVTEPPVTEPPVTEPPVTEPPVTEPAPTFTPEERAPLPESIRAISDSDLRTVLALRKKNGLGEEIADLVKDLRDADTFISLAKVNKQRRAGESPIWVLTRYLNKWAICPATGEKYADAKPRVTAPVVDAGPASEHKMKTAFVKTLRSLGYEARHLVCQETNASVLELPKDIKDLNLNLIFAPMEEDPVCIHIQLVDGKVRAVMTIEEFLRQKGIAPEAIDNEEPPAATAA